MRHSTTGFFITLNVTMMKGSAENSLHIGYSLSDKDIEQNQLKDIIYAMMCELIAADKDNKRVTAIYEKEKRDSKKRIWPSWRKKIPNE